MHTWLKSSDTKLGRYQLEVKCENETILLKRILEQLAVVLFTGFN
jgi:hypothetical protein